MVKKIESKDIALEQKLTVAEGSKAYVQLREQVMAAGILERSYGFYTFLILFVCAGFFLSVYMLYILPVSPLLFFWGIVFSVFSVQLGGLLHDAGHRSIGKTTLANDILGHFFAGLIVMDYSNWKVKHNMHHAHPNQEDEDPDLEIPFTFNDERYRGAKGVVKFIRRYQAYLYFPLGSLVVFSMRFKGLRYLFANYTPRKTFEIVIFLIGFFLWFIAPFLLFPLSKALILFFFVNPIIGVYLMNVFAPNHKGMPQVGKGVKFSFAEQQILTSRNIHGSFLNDALYMGLNYQIEHHLFPSTPRNKLKLVTPFVKRFCRKQGLTYTATSVIESNKIILSELQQVSASS